MVIEDVESEAPIEAPDVSEGTAAHPDQENEITSGVYTFRLHHAEYNG